MTYLVLYKHAAVVCILGNVSRDVTIAEEMCIVFLLSLEAYVLLWTPAQRKRASMLFFANVFFKIFYGRLILRPWLTELRASFTRGVP